MKSLLVFVFCMLIWECINLNHKLSHKGFKCSPNCLVCDSGKCTKCNRGLYSFRNACFESCPLNTFADNYTFSCLEKEKNPFYMKAYTLSRCVNSCGKVFHECSCHPRCEKSGECCSDYQICEIIGQNHSTDCLVSNCKFCSTDRKMCLQCKENFFYNNSKCSTSCPENSNPNSQNICFEKNDSPEKCEPGTYFHDGKCLKSCPQGLRANRIDFTCKNEKQFSFYWIFPSRESCENKCGDNTKSDCSCKFTCLRRGNCCDNFEKECVEEMNKEKCSKLCDNCVNGKCEKCKNNSKMDNNTECQCHTNFNYNIEEDICVLDKLHELEQISNDRNITKMSGKLDRIIKAKNSLKNEKIVFLAKSVRNDNEETDKKSQNVITNNSKLPINIGLDVDTKNHPLYFTNNNTDFNSSNHINKEYDHISSSLTSHLKSTFFKLMNLIKSNPQDKNDQMALYLNGNISLNLMNDNVGTRIINTNKYTVNSSNVNSQNKHNINSFNKLSKIKKQGNVVKSINKGEINSGNTFNTEQRKDEMIYRKIDVNTKSHVDHEKTFSDLDYINNNNIYNNTVNLLHKESMITNPTPKSNVINYSINNNSKIGYPTSQTYQNPHKYVYTQSPINKIKAPLPHQQNIPSPQLESYKSSLQSDNKRSLILGENNLVKDNHVIHNIITVHNSYVIPARNISNMFKGSRNDKDISQFSIPKTIIVVNANKMITNATKEELSNKH